MSTATLLVQPWHRHFSPLGYTEAFEGSINLLRLAFHDHMKHHSIANAHSKKAHNHAHDVALNFFFFMHSFCRAHTTLTKAAGVKTSPAMGRGWRIGSGLLRTS